MSQSNQSSQSRAEKFAIAYLALQEARKRFRLAQYELEAKKRDFQVAQDGILGLSEYQVPGDQEPLDPNPPW